MIIQGTAIGEKMQEKTTKQNKLKAAFFYHLICRVNRM